MKVVRLLLMSAILTFGTAHAGGIYTGLIKPFYYSSSLYLDVTGLQMCNRPACATRTYVRLVEIDPADSLFKHKLAMLLSAWASERAIRLDGTGTCTTEGDELVFTVIPQ